MEYKVIEVETDSYVCKNDFESKLNEAAAVGFKLVQMYTIDCKVFAVMEREFK